MSVNLSTQFVHFGLQTRHLPPAFSSAPGFRQVSVPRHHLPLPQMHSPQEISVEKAGDAAGRTGTGAVRSVCSRKSSTQIFLESVGHVPRPALAEPEDDEDFPQRSFPDCVHGSCADASGFAGEFAVPAAGSGSRHLNGVNSGLWWRRRARYRHSHFVLLALRDTPRTKATNKFRTKQNQLSQDKECMKANASRALQL